MTNERAGAEDPFVIHLCLQRHREQIHLRPLRRNGIYLKLQ